MIKDQTEEQVEDIYQNLLKCKDLMANLCNQEVDQPNLKVGFELGTIYMIILRMTNDVVELKENLK